MKVMLAKRKRHTSWFPCDCNLALDANLRQADDLLPPARTDARIDRQAHSMSLQVRSPGLDDVPKMVLPKLDYVPVFFLRWSTRDAGLTRTTAHYFGNVWWKPTHGGVYGGSRYGGLAAGQ